MEGLIKQVTQTESDDLLRLDIQFFSEDGGEGSGTEDGSEGEPKDEDLDVGADDDSKDDNNKDDDKGSVEFTEEQQREMDRIIQERLARERRIQQEKQEKERQKEQGEYKELYEATQKELRDKVVHIEMSKAGYTDDQVERLSEYIKGTTDDEIKQSLQTFMEDVPPKKVERTEPGGRPAGGTTPPPKDGKDVGRELYKAIKKKKPQ